MHAPHPFDDPLWGYLSKMGYSDNRYVSADIEGHFTERVRDSEAPVVVPGSKGYATRAIGRIVSDGETVATMGVVDNDESLDGEDLLFLQYACCLLGGEFEKRKYTDQFKGNFSSLMCRDLLLMTAETKEEVLSRLPEFYFPNARRTVVVVPLPACMLSIGDFLKSEVGRRTVYTDCILLGDREELVVVGEEHSSYPRTSFLLAIADVIGAHGLRGGAGAPCEEIRHLQESYLTAEAVLRLPKGEGALIDFSEHRPEAFLANADMAVPKRLFCHEALKKLTAYDASTHTELSNTLRTYVLCGCSLSQAADALFLHRNTLRNRLCRIEEVTGLDLADSDTQFDIRFSYMLIDLCGR